MLYLVSTPIGNIGDITYRAIEVLFRSNYILAEDTRRTKKLLLKYEIRNRLISYNDINKKKKTPAIIKDLINGLDIALVTDSGTPGISDPGFYLVRECIKSNIKISPIPGSTAAISALICSGLPTDKFSFYGFLPKTQGKLINLLKEIRSINHTVVFYESPHRILKTLQMISEIMPEKQVVVAREMTKKFEEFIRGTPDQVLTQLKSKKIQGEFTVVIK